MIIRDARPGELAAVGDLRVAAYGAGGFLSPTSGYAQRLRALGSDGEGSVLVAVAGDADIGWPGPAGSGEPPRPAEPPGPGGRIVGTIMLQTSPHAAEIMTGPDEAEIRALAVAPGAQGKGIGRALLQAVLERAASLGAGHLVLSTRPEMHAAHRLYEQAGFRRLPDRDWSPEPGTDLIAYGLLLDGQASAG